MTNQPPQSESVLWDELLCRLREGQVAVFGDFCLDAYWWITPEGHEKSLETGLPVQQIYRQRYCLAGAGNVVANLIDLGVREVRAIGVVGSDVFGTKMLCLLRECGADVSAMISRDDWQTMVYAKRYLGQEEKNRLDFGMFNTLAREASESLLESLDWAASRCGVVVINQQISAGISAPEMILRINELSEKHSETVFIVDARNRAALFTDVVYKLNAREAAELLGESCCEKNVHAASAPFYAERLHKKTGRPVFVTRGDRGIVVADVSGVHEIPGIEIAERTDPVGAGDTVVAGLAAVLASGGDPVAAAQLANVAASITVRKLQTTGTATPEEIRLLGSDPDYVCSPELAEDIRRASYLEGAEIELAADLPDRMRIEHAIFDHDGTLSTLREGWEEVMQPMMVAAILGRHFPDVDRVVYNSVQDTVREFIDKTTGVQTLVQMQGLVRMVRQFEFVPEAEVLDEHGYKHLYNERLLDVVLRRRRKLQSAELAPEDFQIKNAGELLRSLSTRGVKLYLASGTDEADVRREAEAMGYADVFEGRIFGAIGNVKIEAKKVVLERILQQHRLAEGGFATFGDGPVEMRETRKRGGICVGVASDEVRRSGLNLVKRTRLIRAGAHLIVPDFSQLAMLLSVLQLN